MQRAIDFLKENISESEIPVAAIIVKDGDVISAAYNRKEKENDVTSHAEILALREASKNSDGGVWRIVKCTLH